VPLRKCGVKVQAICGGRAAVVTLKREKAFPARGGSKFLLQHD
jgi:hypothetical protein